MYEEFIPCIVNIGRYQWFPIKLMGDKYFIIAIKPLFKGYYSIDPFPFAQTNLSMFLNDKFISFLVEDGIDITQFSNMAIPTQGQYNMYIKNKLPPCGAYLLQSPKVEDNQTLAIDTDENIIATDIKAIYNVRPCCFVNAEYLRSIIDKPIITTESICVRNT